ncbi:hypothetical protein SAMN05660297_00411 [Natronincola peptidivorans]|uniref:Uncharacterized protein n=1 Tax=Natronincola peptidivorans TaxID=426128 RepID=A0A1H9YUB8_9FIRM|nr:hypothetical protein [Natronincola peptidivorans]SES72762.1 hypothetical protein SAMN05660297_00411 [Natronincola peptidivorans]
MSEVNKEQAQAEVSNQPGFTPPAPSPVQPGQCPINPRTGLPQCPPPDRIECIVVDKVYDSCFQVDTISRDLFTDEFEFGTGLELGDAVLCGLTEGAEITCTEINRTAVGDGFFTITLSISVPVTLTNPEATNGEPNEINRVFTFIKTVTLCAPEGVDPDCSESTLLFCNCVVTNINDFEEEAGDAEYTISCEIQVCLVIKTILRVQLLVPSYGFCVPAPCVTLPGVCPPLPPEQCF